MSLIKTVPLKPACKNNNYGEVSNSKTPFFFYPSDLIREFIGKHVIVEAERHQVRGILAYFTIGNKHEHIPDTLVLKGEFGWIVLRIWNIVKEG